MELFTAIFAGLMQGIFEWLPISSQGNIMAFLMSIFSMSPEDSLKIVVLLHSGTLLAAIIYFRKELAQILSFKTNEDKSLARFFLIATLATAITAIPMYLLLKFALSEIGLTIPYFLLAIAILLIFTGFIQLNKKLGTEMKLSNKNAIITGLAQGFSVLPGISRSGITTTALLFNNANPEQAFKLSFLMSIPAVFLAEICFGLLEGVYFEGYAFVALIVAFIVEFLSIGFFIKMARKINFSYFCFALALLYIVISISMIFF
jgi:undecaprenyl-diphosphatase